MRPATAFAASAAVPSGRPRAAKVCASSGPRMTAAVATHSLNGRSISSAVVPAGNHVLVRVAEAAEETSGGLILSSGAKEKPTHGEAVAVGDGKFLGGGLKVPMAVKQGDTVLYGKYGGTDVDYDGEKHTFLTQDDILCVLEGGEYAAEAVRPIFDRVLVKRDEMPEESAGGIVLGKAGEKPTSGRVVAVGPGRLMENGETEPIEFQIGDAVMFGKYAGTEVAFRGEDYMLIRIADVFARWE